MFQEEWCTIKSERQPTIYRRGRHALVSRNGGAGEDCGIGAKNQEWQCETTYPFSYLMTLPPERPRITIVFSRMIYAIMPRKPRVMGKATTPYSSVEPRGALHPITLCLRRVIIK
jgi:hypothetical protein